MIVGTVKEIKIQEHRVGLTPAGAHSLVSAGHKVLVQKEAGVGSGFTDKEYKDAGAKIIADGKSVWEKADTIIKVKEPQKKEFSFLRKDLILFTYLHLAAEAEVTKQLLAKKAIGVAYETVELADGKLPLLTPMSEVAGRMAVHIGAWFLQKPNGGRGKLLGGVPGVYPGDVVIFGTGTVGINAAKIALGMGAKVTIFGRRLEMLRYLDDIFGPRIHTQVSTAYAIQKAIQFADLVIGGVLITGAKAPKLVTRKMLKKMKSGAVIIDVSIDQGGCFETSRPTTHADPTFEVDGIIHYCVTNMPGAVPKTSTVALTNATLPYALRIANYGIIKAAQKNEALKKGINTINGKLTCQGVAEAFGIKYTPIEKVLEIK